MAGGERTINASRPAARVDGADGGASRTRLPLGRDDEAAPTARRLRLNDDAAVRAVLPV